jgi:hypothetical protein
MTQKDLRQLRFEPPPEMSTQEQDWPADFWQAFEDFPDDFERPVQVPQDRDLDL